MSPQTDVKPYVRTDEFGVMRVGSTPISLDSVVYPFNRGDTPESIRSQYDLLTLEEVYGAITYYLGHRAEVDAYLLKQEAIWERERARMEANRPPIVDRLRAIMAERAKR